MIMPLAFIACGTFYIEFQLSRIAILLIYALSYTNNCIRKCNHLSEYEDCLQDAWCQQNRVLSAR